MRILVVADPHIPVPPVHYGGAERTIATLCAGLARRGHTVDLIAAPGSESYGGRLFTHRPPTAAKLSRAYRKLRFQFTARRAARPADLIVSFGRLDYLRSILRRPTPLVLAFQNPALQSELDYVLARRGRSVRFVGVSRDQMTGLVPADLVDVVHNGADTARLAFSPAPADPPYLAFLGRLTENKGVHLAIDAAGAAGVKLVIAGNVSDAEPGARAYFEERVKPRLGPAVEYVGPVNDAAKAKLLGAARALLFPIQWREPCALVVPEALACGCPVIGWRNGSVPEVVRHGETGFVVESVEEMAAAIRNVGSIDRAACRRDAEARFSPDALVEGYLRVFVKLLPAIPR